jgi:alkyldihydroxyacetonephosphate synthase
LRPRASRAQRDDAPDAVLAPGSHDEVLELLRACAAHRVAVVPFGGGSSVVGGLAPARDGFDAVVCLDLRRLDRLVSVDPESRTATLEPGVRGPRAEALVGEHGFTIGHFPQSFEFATIGGFAAARSSGQSSAGYGRFDEMVVGLTLATPEGAIVLGTAPKSAAGPDLRQLVLGSEGAFGVITSVTVRLRPVPEASVYEGWRFASFAAGAAALRRLVQDGPTPTVLRLSDEAETAVNLARPDAVGTGEGPAGCLALVGFEGTTARVAARRAEAAAVLADAGGEALGPEPGESWSHGRYDGPYLRDALLSAGALVETLETVTFWSNLPRLYAAVREALTESLAGQGTQPIVLCHISHVYETGASLYFTVASAQAGDPIAQWRAAKAAACDAIIEAGASITHHHAVGTDHRDWYEREIGPLAVAALQAVKARLDPAGIMNPGVLIPPVRTPATLPRP